MSRDQLQKAIGLQDRKSFRVLYLAPALAAGLIEMTIPEKPNSRLQNTGWPNWAGRGCHKVVSSRQAGVDAVGENVGENCRSVDSE
jgi:hypothetical protein